jgi:hypothetical protein
LHLGYNTSLCKKGKKMIKIFTLLSVLITFTLAQTENSCMTCHEGVADIRDRNSGMMQAILQKAEEAGVKGNDCVVCHGGEPPSKKEGRGARRYTKIFYRK